MAAKSCFHHNFRTSVANLSNILGQSFKLLQKHQIWDKAALEYTDLII